MNKNEFIDALAVASGLSRTDAGKAVEGFVKVVTETLVAGEEVRLVGFGTFRVSERAASTGRNPRTGEPMDLLASKTPKFKPGKLLADAVSNA